jgi:hypothetical protein
MSVGDHVHLLPDDPFVRLSEKVQEHESLPSLNSVVPVLFRIFHEIRQFPFHEQSSSHAMIEQESRSYLGSNGHVPIVQRKCIDELICRYFDGLVQPFRQKTIHTLYSSITDCNF